jgi:hypothetical protein
MMAWVHVAVATEHELVSKVVSGGAAAPKVEVAAAAAAAAAASNGSDEDSNGGGGGGLVAAAGGGGGGGENNGGGVGITADVSVILDRVFEGLCRPLKVRVEQVLTGNNTNSVVAFRLSNLLSFYDNTLSALIGHSTMLSRTIQEIETAAFSTMRYAPPAELLLSFPFYRSLSVGL